jgi:putative solute:sodium symporter small subunit
MTNPDVTQALRWRRTLRMTAVLLALWLAASFAVVLFARELGFTLFAAPFGVWMAGQGALVVFLCIVWINYWLGRRIDDGDGAAPEGDS